ncbi:MAG: thiamine pyrophosphate-binding protein [Porphyromonadaceae bacterium]|nr:thiamine pyrophosphate-binding protein [Porphyromonadaceae bacterium]
MNVGDLIVDYLEAIGVDTVFGGSGQSDSAFLFALSRTEKIKTVIPRHEQAASFMACGYAMYSDKLGVCFCTAGPGAVNLLSGLSVAYSDSLPLLSLPAYTPREMRGKGDLGDTSGLSRTPDGQAIFSAVTKKSFILEDPSKACDILEEAINLAFEGRPGPVNVHVDYSIYEEEVPNYRPFRFHIKPVLAAQEDLEKAAAALTDAINRGKKVMALVGYGTIRSHAEGDLLKMLEAFRIPFCTTMDAKGALPETHPLCLGTFGTSGDPGVKKYFKETNLVLAVGNSFAKWNTWRFKDVLFENKELIHINIDPHEIDKVYKADYPILSDARPAVVALHKKMIAMRAGKLLSVKATDQFRDVKLVQPGTKIHPAMLVREISRLSPEKSIILGDAGGHMLWLHAYLTLDKGRNYQNPGSFGPMAANVNASIGVKYANPDRPVIVACGDGDYQMAGFELMTAVQENVPVIWIIFNNSEFNIIKFFQLRANKKEVFNHFLNPDYVKYAEACGAQGFRVTEINQFEAAFTTALGLGKPALIDVVVDPEIYPPFAAFDD